MKELQTKRSDHQRFLVFLSILLVMVFIRYALQIDLPRVVYLGIIFLIVALGDPTEIIAMCMCCIPLHESIDFFYAVVICVAIYLVKYHRTIRINSSIFVVLTMIVWELLHCFGNAFSVRELLVDIVPIIALAVFICIDSRVYDYDFVVRTLAITTAVLCVTLLGKVLYASNFNFAKAVLGLQRLGMETDKQGLTENTGVVHPNTLGIICVLATTGLMQLRNTGRYNNFDMLLAMILMVFGALTSSRTYLVCLVTMFLLLIFAQEGSINKKLRFLGFTILIVLAALTVLYIAFPDLIEYYFGRFLVKDITTGRDDLMVAYHNFIVSDPKVLFFGLGFHDFGEKVLSVYRVAVYVPHNGIQEVIVAWGLPGLLIFLVLLIVMILQSGKGNKNQSLMALIPLIILLLKAQAGQMLGSSYTMLAFCYAYLSMCQDFSPKSNNQA